MLQDGTEDRSAPAWSARLGLRPPGRRTGLGLLSLVAFLLALAVGPRARFAGGWVEPDLSSDVQDYLASAEAGVRDLRPEAARSVTWADPLNQGRTPLALVYLHGFSADRHEVEPLVSDLARDLSANVYFARLTGHGRDGAAMAEASAADWVGDAAEAVAIGAVLGDRVLVMGTSTGGTLALWAAAQPEAAGRVAALVLISPNLGLRDPAARVLLWPWGGLVARALTGRDRCFEPETPEQALHWTTCYPTRALLPMAALVEHVAEMDLSAIRVPTLVAYSEDDRVVSPGRILSVLGALAGPEVYVVEDTGDPASHVLAGSILSPGTTDDVRLRVLDFLERAGVAPREGR